MVKHPFGLFFFFWRWNRLAGEEAIGRHFFEWIVLYNATMLRYRTRYKQTWQLSDIIVVWRDFISVNDSNGIYECIAYKSKSSGHAQSRKPQWSIKMCLGCPSQTSVPTPLLELIRSIELISRDKIPLRTAAFCEPLFPVLKNPLAVEQDVGKKQL